MRVGYETADSQRRRNEARNAELAIITSYPTSANGIIVFIKNAHKISRIPPDFSRKNNRFSVCFVLFFAMTAKPIRALELHYLMIQFLMIQAIGRKREGNQEALGTSLRKLS